MHVCVDRPANRPAQGTGRAARWGRRLRRLETELRRRRRHWRRRRHRRHATGDDATRTTGDDAAAAAAAAQPAAVTALRRRRRRGRGEGLRRGRPPEARTVTAARPRRRAAVTVAAAGAPASVGCGCSRQLGPGMCGGCRTGRADNRQWCAENGLLRSFGYRHCRQFALFCSSLSAPLPLLPRQVPPVHL